MLPPNMREQLGGPIVLPSAYLRHAVKSLQVGALGPRLLAGWLDESRALLAAITRSSNVTHEDT